MSKAVGARRMDRPAEPKEYGRTARPKSPKKPRLVVSLSRPRSAAGKYQTGPGSGRYETPVKTADAGIAQSRADEPGESRVIGAQKGTVVPWLGAHGRVPERKRQHDGKARVVGCRQHPRIKRPVIKKNHKRNKAQRHPVEGGGQNGKRKADHAQTELRDQAARREPGWKATVFKGLDSVVPTSTPRESTWDSLITSATHTLLLTLSISFLFLSAPVQASASYQDVHQIRTWGLRGKMRKPNQVGNIAFRAMGNDNQEGGSCEGGKKRNREAHGSG
ncbi:hypothetical protein EDB85DRAFT_1892573 [Lactarius pseudohatsudake]|nr:hypothetical protein EDB85DRAFT_1892573 [Lactarius pseudohatsudake]